MPVRIAATAAAAVAGLTLAVADIALSGPLNDDVWLPPLAVTTVEGATTVYVLRDDGDRRTVLGHSPREVTVLQDTDVTDERLCALRPGADGRSLWDLANGAAESGAPSCPR